MTLGNGLAAYPEGLDSLRNHRDWLDTIAILLRQRLGRTPSADELRSVDKDIEREATGRVLRNLHAKHAERLALVSWKDRLKDEEYHLIEDTELRRSYGAIIGRIAHSHWWSVDKLRQEFDVLIGAPAGFPREWTVDPLKLACLLRVSDASHLDARRSPGFLRALRKPPDFARLHWIFQEHLHQPQLKDDRLVYTSGHAFSIEEAPSWWLCFDTLQMVDRELQHVDALLADSGRGRLAGRGVAGVEEPRRLAKWIPTDNWLPIDTHIKVTNVATLVSSLGGEQLYGQDNTVPLRELIQNASDAVRARRLIEGRSQDYGDVCVRIGKDSKGQWIEVEDNGVGMSTKVLTGPLLDFGTAFWGSTLMLSEFPGLLSMGFESAGKYGIGFFSIFMWGDRVRVTTRSYKDAPRDTQVLEFDSGLASRPILRRAREAEFLRDGGTCIRVCLKNPPQSFDGLFYLGHQRDQQTREELCAWLCPSIDVNLYVQREEEERRVIVTASDWIEIEGQELLRRIWRCDSRTSNRGGNIPEKADLTDLSEVLSSNLRLIVDSSGEIVGRACIMNRDFPRRVTDYGVITVGGLRASRLAGIAGILVGIPKTAARDIAIPVVKEDKLSEWASGQADLVPNITKDSKALVECGEFIRACHGYTGRLPVALSKNGWVSTEDIYEWKTLPKEVLLVQDAAVSLERRKFTDLKLNDNVLAMSMGYPGILQSRRPDSFSHWPGQIAEGVWGFHHGTLAGAVIEALAKAWSSPLDEVIHASTFGGDREKVEAEIGQGDGEPVVLSVYIIRKPQDE